MTMVDARLRQLVHLLNDGEYHCQQELSEKLAMLPHEIDNSIQQLQSLAIDVTVLRRNGYQLSRPLHFLDGARIQQYARRIGVDITQIPIDIFASIGSTNDYLKTTCDAPHLCLAEQQTQGRGRFNRKWFSPFAQNIYASFAWSTRALMSELSGLSAVVALALLAALENYGINLPLSIKWPNDIYYADKKLAGVLIQSIPASNGGQHVIIGIGLNVNLADPTKQIDQPWTSLYCMAGVTHDRNLIIAHLLKTLLAYLYEFSAHGFSHFIARWQRSDYLYGKEIALNHLGEIIYGVAQGVDQQGALILQQGEQQRRIHAGDASLHK